MTEDPRHLIADHLTPASEEPAPPSPDVKALIEERLNPAGCTDQEDS